MVSLAFVTNGFEDAVELSQARLPPDSPAAQVPPGARASGRAATAASTAVAAATTSTASAAAAEAGGRGVRALWPGRGRHPCRRHGTHLRLRPRLRARHGILQRVRSPPPRRGNGCWCSHRHIAAAPAAASDARAPAGGANSLFGGASLLFRGVASGDRGGAGGAWSSSPLESKSCSSINGSEWLGASSLDGSSLGSSINEDASRGGDDAGPLGTSEPTQQDHHHHHVHEAEQRAARQLNHLLQSCWPQLPPSLRAWLFSGAFLRECAAKFQALDVGSQGCLDLGRRQRQERTNRPQRARRAAHPS
jgi:hypothetical protein